MVETSIEVIESIKPLSLVERTKEITKEVLYAYSLKYLKKHVYISSKNLSGAYVFEHYNLTHTSIEYRKIRGILSHKFRFTIGLLLREKMIIGYSPKLYRRVNINPSLYNDTPKIELDVKNKVSKLVYHQGRFVNPKFHDIE